MPNRKEIEIEKYLAEVHQRADKLVDKFIAVFFLLGLMMAPVYETWVFSLCIGGLNVVLYILAKFIGNKFVSRQIISLVFSVFMLQFIGQMHGMAEAHFFFFTNIAILIIYQDWRMMLPYTIFAIAHHSAFFYFQLLGYDHLGEYFINYAEVNFQVLLFHYGLAILMAVIAGWWAILFKNQSIKMVSVREEVKEKNDRLQASEEEMKQQVEELQATQESLAQAQRQLSFVLGETGVGIWQYNISQDSFTWDRQCKVNLGVPEEEDLSAEDWREMIEPEDLPNIFASLQEFLEGKTSNTTMEYRWNAPDGRKVNVFAKASLFKDHQGALSIVGTLEDFSDRKAKEAEIKQLSLVASKTFNGVIITDARGHIQWVNAGFERITGYALAEVLGRKPSMLQGKDTDPEHVARIRQKLDKRESFTQEILNYSKEGKPYWLELSITPILNKKGELTNFIGIERDITARRKMEEKIKMQNDDLQSSLEQIINLQQQSERSRVQSQKLLENMQASVNYAQRIQNAIIPAEKDLKDIFSEAFVYYKPRDIVSGDFYWVAEKGNKKIIAVGDCTGHGVPGAFMTMIAHNMLNQLVHNQEIHDPSTILSAIPALLAQTLTNSESNISDGMDIAIVSIEKVGDAKTITYSGAMLPLYYVEEGQLQEIKADKMTIGGKRNENLCHIYDQHTITLRKSSMIYLSSDGFKDQFGGENNTKFLSKNFRALLQSVAKDSIDEQRLALDESFTAWKGQQKQTDDVLVIGIGL